ncbi:MAG: hypothetical protein Q9195_007392 [Heterodermia aff. obscurata]
MALNGLVSRDIAGNVKTFTLHGEWKDYGVEECAEVGRVPDNDMMLSSLIRVALEKMTALQSFSLVGLTIYDIDPLCYADDVSVLLLESKKLRELNMIWSPRMKDVREPSISWSTYFGRIAGSPYRMTLHKIAIKNLYAHSDGGCGQVFDPSMVREIATIRSIGGGLDDNLSSAFLDPSWGRDHSYGLVSLKVFRSDTLSRSQCGFLGSIKGLERVYLIDTRISHQERLNGIDSPASSNCTSSSDCSNIDLKDGYLDAFTKHHGNTLRHLLLPPQWRLNTDDIALIVRRCPNLEQLGIGAEYEEFNNLRLLVPFLPKLRALRLLVSPDDRTFADKMKQLDAEGLHEEKLGAEPTLQDSRFLTYMGLGDIIFKLDSRESDVYVDRRRKVQRMSYDDVKHVEIWALDSADI